MKRKVKLKERQEVEEMLKALGWEPAVVVDEQIQVWHKADSQTSLKVSIGPGAKGRYILLEGSINDVELMSLALNLDFN